MNEYQLSRDEFLNVRERADDGSRFDGAVAWTAYAADRERWDAAAAQNEDEGWNALKEIICTDGPWWVAGR